MQTPAIIYRVIPHLFFWLSLLFSGAVNAQDISVEYAHNTLQNDTQHIDAMIKLDFDEEVIEALEYGVALVIDIQIQLRRKRKWVWNELIKEEVLHYQLRHHPLSDDYLVTNLDTDERVQLQTLHQALRQLGTLKAHPFISNEMLSEDENYIGLIKAQFNIESLPAPLQPGAYVSSQLRLESPWYEWVFK